MPSLSLRFILKFANLAAGAGGQSRRSIHPKACCAENLGAGSNRPDLNPLTPLQLQPPSTTTAADGTTGRGLLDCQASGALRRRVDRSVTAPAQEEIDEGDRSKCEAQRVGQVNR